jgi:hypothetical protein
MKSVVLDYWGLRLGRRPADPAAGTPMLLMGDEMRHTRLGNNNA